MRKSFLSTLMEIAGVSDKIVFLTADLGFMAVEPFASQYPERFYNVGVAEQNLVGIATGMAEAGYIPFIYSIVSFSVLRPYEFIRNGPIAHRLPVRIVGVGGGVEYSKDGISHYGLEDVGVLRVQPGITIVTPADSNQARQALLQTWNLPNPVYYRLGKDDRYEVPDLNGRFEIDKVQIVRPGHDVLLLTMGSIVPEAVQASINLAKQGVSAMVGIVSNFNPAPVEHLKQLLPQFPLAVTVEAHYITGGLGSLVAEVIADNGLACRVLRCGFKTVPDGVSGSLKYMYDRYGLSSASIENATLKELSKK